MSRPRPPLSVLLAIGLVLVLLLWLALGDFERFRDTAPPAGEAEVSEPPRVEVVERLAEDHAPRLVVQGQLEAHRELELRARQAGRVSTLPVALGSRVARGEVLLEIARDELPERLEQAEAELALARAELAGADELRRRDLISNIDYLRLHSGAARAVAELAALRRQLDETRPAAPFDGVLDRLDVEPGDLLQVGDSWGRLVDDSRLVASGWVPQREAQGLTPGLDAELRPLDGSRLTGELTHVASRADESTRSFRIEVAADNPARRRLAGASASLIVTLPVRRVHRLSPALLELDEAGRLAVKILDEEDRVVRRRVTLVDADAGEARVAGLPERVRLITLGGGFVAPGERVTPVPSEVDAPAEAAFPGSALPGASSLESSDEESR
ncbi:efflux RND transporter periplasmic adaptor subunit [Halomonas sp. EGI 63088]|uniref:Efflux RND transporter periplasmic adaptor subunit n=1 Tax=Halomonas flagellata TaxID=2920385 RepID=A0ABS9RU84_9GAMM|nr:efflux RND transporter periplasmic adaptor subunit [Halomonas flagellata]MCH4563418.1 efflux RND transporter periplasmic adaptor subunit [Halomonas flagellata]